MLVGSRPASAGVQVAALLLGILGGLVSLDIIGAPLSSVLSPGLTLLVVWACIAACAYFLAAPATWRGLLRRLASLGLGLLAGLAAFRVFLDLLPFAIPGILAIVLLALALGLAVYFVTLPETWRGLFRRALRVLGVSLALFAGLGYLFAFIGLSQAVDVPTGSMPDLPPAGQLAVVVGAVVTLLLSLALRERPTRDRPAAAPIAPGSAGPAPQPPAVDPSARPPEPPPSPAV